MIDPVHKPRLIRFDDVVVLVGELRRMGVSGASIYERITEIGPVDLDLLNDVLACEANVGSEAVAA